MAKEKNYKKIAAKRITRPSESQRKPKILIYARNKKGKTKLTMTAPNLLILDPEHGTDKYTKSDPSVWHITKWEDMQDAYGYLRTGDHPYEWVGVDGITRFNNMALRYVGRVEEERNLDRQPGMVDRRDYNKSGELMKQMLTNFHNLDMGVIYTAQERAEATNGGNFDEDNEEEDDSINYVPDLPKGVRGYVNSVVDVIGRLYLQRVPQGEKEVMQRRLWIGPHERYDTGFRSEYDLPDVIKNPTIPKLNNLILNGEVKKKGKK